MLVNGKGPAGRDAAVTLALRALGFVAGDPALGPRFLDLTGLDSATLRARAGTDAVLLALLDFLAGHEPSLVETAAALDVPPAALAAAQRTLAA